MRRQQACVVYKRNLEIVQQDRAGTTLRRRLLSRAWPVKFVAGDWNNGADENVIESVTLSYDFFELVQWARHGIRQDYS
jgi:hypothetical protein